MMNLPFHRCITATVLGGVLMMAGCSQGSAPAPDAAQVQAKADAAAANRNLDTYRQLLRIGNDQMAVSMGEDILHRYPDSDAAKEVQKTLPEIEKRYKVSSEKRRLAGLWLYQVSPMEGGTQSTATIYSSKPSGNDRVRLVLRRHTDWGQSAFLYGGHGFACKGNCTVSATFDGKKHGIKAFLPHGGEPAMFIRDDKGFISLLQKAKKLTLKVTPKDSGKPEELVYEVGGFDPAKWSAVGKGKKK